MVPRSVSPDVSPDEYLTAVMLGVVQGLGEFLPVSSSGHLVVTPWLLRRETSALNDHAYDVALHIGTTGALLLFFWRDWLCMARQAHRLRSPAGRRFWLVAVASVPGAAAGYLIEEHVATTLRTPLVVALTIGVMGGVLYAVDRRSARDRALDDLGVRDAVLFGAAQAVALVPGVSRSGATITMGRALGFGPADAAQFSFLMAAPITLGAFLLKARALRTQRIDGPFVTGVAVSGITGVAAIRLLRRALQRRAGLLPFAVYRIAFALVIVLVSAWRRWNGRNGVADQR